MLNQDGRYGGLSDGAVFDEWNASANSPPAAAVLGERYKRSTRPLQETSSRWSPLIRINWREYFASVCTNLIHTLAGPLVSANIVTTCSAESWMPELALGLLATDRCNYSAARSSFM